MKKKTVLAIGILLSLLAVTAFVGWAIAAGTFSIPWNSAMGGGGGGDLSSSASYTLLGSNAGAVLVQSSSTTYQLCSGYVCGGIPSIKLYLPLVIK